MYAETRGFIPVVVYRLNRCNDDDRKVLLQFFKRMKELLNTPSEEEALVSTLEYYLILFSEMWESPTPDLATMNERYANAAISAGPISSMLSLYRAFTKDTSAACTALNITASSAPAIAYKKDKYWNVAAKISAQASVLLMSGKLDPQTPHKYAERLFNVLDGSKKELIAFEFAAHGALFNTRYNPYLDAYGWTPLTPKICGGELLASYVKNNGDFSKLDKTCVAAANSYMADLDPAKAFQNMFFYLNSDDVYDGETYFLRLKQVQDGGDPSKERRVKRRKNAQAQIVTDGDALRGSPTNAAAYEPPIESGSPAARV
ncbi:hypothetical protein FI667_g4311, partial [Globisporangium splendens]